MKISYNFISLVAIGNFNPAIVSPHFLNNVCQLNLGEHKDLVPANVPVLRGLQFGSLSLIIELERLQFKESEIRDVHQTRVINIFYEFFNKLPFTPLKTVGVNINLNIETELYIEQKIKKYDDIIAFFKSDRLETEERHSRSVGEALWLNTRFRIPNVESSTRLIDVARVAEDNFVLNYNYQVENLAQEPSRIDLISSKYDSFCKEFIEFTHLLEK